MDKRKVDLIYKHGEIEDVEEFGSIKELLEMEEVEKAENLRRDFRNLISNNKEILLKLAKNEHFKNKENKSSEVKGSVTISLKDYQVLVEEKRVAQATLQIFVDTIHEIQPLIEKNICSKNHRETIYILEQLDEALEYYYG